MVDFNQDTFFIKYTKLRRVLLILIPILIAVCIIGLDSSNPVLFATGAASLFLLFIDIAIAIALLTKKYYNWIIVFLILVTIAIIFRHQRWPLSGVLFTFGFGGLGIVSLLSSFRFLMSYRHIPFLRYIGFTFSIVLFLVSIGLLWKNMHWPLTNFLISIGMVTFIPFLFAFLFTLPNSNYINWNESERIVFFRAIILPMIFVYSLSVLMLVFPEIWISLTRSSILPFGMRDINLLYMPGLQ